MIVQGLRMDSPLKVMSEQLEQAKVKEHTDVDCIAYVKTSGAYINFKSGFDKEYPGRPYMVLIGECVKLEGELPCDVSSLMFSEGIGIQTDIVYEFSDNELSDMAAKGLFDSRFQIPKEFIGATIDIPVKCNFTVIEPNEVTKVPLLFANIENNRNVSVNIDTCDWAFGFEFDEIERSKDETTLSLDDFVDEKDFESDFIKPEVVEAEMEPVEEKPVADIEIDKKVEEISKRVESKKDLKLQEKSKKSMDEVDFELDELVSEDKADSSELIEKEDESLLTDDFDDLFLNPEDISLSELEAESIRSTVQKVDRAEDLEESIETDEKRPYRDNSTLPESIRKKLEEINTANNKNEKTLGE